MKVYLSGPMSGRPDFNYDAFSTATVRLTKNGMTVLSPTSIGQHEGWSWDQYMGSALALQVQADATYMLPGWRESKGARVEHEFAKALGHKIFGSAR